LASGKGVQKQEPKARFQVDQNQPSFRADSALIWRWPQPDPRAKTPPQGIGAEFQMEKSRRFRVVDLL